MATNASRAQELLSKSSYCRNSKHARCKTTDCGCRCHTAPEARIEQSELDRRVESAPVPTQKQIEATLAAEAPAPKAKRASRSKKATPPPAPVTLNLTGNQKRALREQMVTYLAAMPFELGAEMGDGCLDGVTPEQAAAYVDAYWVKFIDPARFNGRAIIGSKPGATA